MPKLYVVTVGLYGIFDAGSTGILLLRKAIGETVDRERIPDHIASVVFRAGGVRRETPLNGQDVNFLFDGRGSFGIQDERRHLLNLPRLLQRAGLVAVVDGECLGNTGGCASRLAGRVLLPGGILRPVEVAVRGGSTFFVTDESSLEVLARHSVRSGVRELDFVMTTVANASRWQADFSGGARLKIGRDEIALERAGRQDLLDVGADPSESDSYVVWVLNTPRGHDIRVLLEREIKPDKHFALLYDLLRSEGELERWVPVVRSPRSLLETPPGSQCIPPRLS